MQLKSYNDFILLKKCFFVFKSTQKWLSTFNHCLTRPATRFLLSINSGLSALERDPVSATCAITLKNDYFITQRHLKSKNKVLHGIITAGASSFKSS